MNQITNQRKIEATQASPRHSAITPAIPAKSMIWQSRRRCAAFGLAETDRPDYSAISSNNLALAIEQSRALHDHAVPVMETLYEQIVNTHNMVILTDAEGLILHTLGDDDFLARADKVALQPGVLWSEQSKGTNAIGTAIAEQAAVLVHAHDHYLHANHFLTCSAAPILDPAGGVVGVLDVTGDQNSYHRHTMALARMSVQMIENRLFAAAYPDAIMLHFHSRPEFIGTLVEGIASFTPGGRFLSANRSGLFQLGLPLAALQSHSFSSLFGLPVSALFDHYRTAAPSPMTMCMHNGVRVFGKAELRLSNTIFQRASESIHQSAPSVRRDAASRPASSRLQQLNTGDPAMSGLIAKLDRVIGRDIPILITGETGTGKELLAQAIHHDSARGRGPFVAVNCASIPETLIESELFGYDEGAFTGARRKGNSGKILQANGGTLFLDEIGDMPLSLQARLLRVLQERVVTPLGSGRAIPVNLTVICATHRNLRELIAQQRFREDLYYRLNGLVVKLPPLRERTDLEALAKKIIAEESCGVLYTLTQEVMQIYTQHQWPGNLRQLANLLRTAIAMAGSDNEIRREHLPDDFMEDFIQSEQPASPMPSSPPSGARLEDMELSLIQKTLEAHQGNVSAAARTLGVSRNTIYRKLNVRHSLSRLGEGIITV